MNKIIPIALTLGCIGAGAATSNYDLLGRKGSQMNSPMVYRNVDYSKVKKDEEQKVGPSLEAHSLRKMGMSSGVSAMEGAYRSGQAQNKLFYFKKYNPNGEDCTGSSTCLYNWNDYISRSNDAFIDVNTYTGSVQYGSQAPWSYLSSYVGNFNPSIVYTTRPSPYYSGDNINYLTYSGIKVFVDFPFFGNVASWYNNRASKVGIYMATEGLPSKLKTTKDVFFLRDNTTDTFKDGPGYENRESKTFNLIKETTTHRNIDRSVVFVGRNDPSDPANKTPQIYMCVRNDRVSYTSDYTNAARDLDNFIYQYRTLEFVPVGNNGRKNKYLNSQAHAANAVTVGPVNGHDVSNHVITNYASSITHADGSDKPEIYNYSDFRNIDDYSEQRKDYYYGGNNYSYQPYYDGSEVATAYTAGMVADFLAINPFYRWHPEVVKAFLITADGGRDISNASSSAVTNKTLSYRYLMFDYAESNNGEYKYESRYWNGDVNKLKTRTFNNRPEIWFVTRNLGNGSKETKAAISWLSSGDDIVSNNGKVPQDFDLIVYGSNSTKYECMTKPGVNLNSSPVCNGNTFDFNNPGEELDRSVIGRNSFEKVSFVSDYKYLIFKIQLWGDNSSSANKGQIALGFNASAHR